MRYSALRLLARLELLIGVLHSLVVDLGLDMKAYVIIAIVVRDGAAGGFPVGPISIVIVLLRTGLEREKRVIGCLHCAGCIRVSIIRDGSSYIG